MESDFTYLKKEYLNHNDFPYYYICTATYGKVRTLWVSKTELIVPTKDISPHLKFKSKSLYRPATKEEIKLFKRYEALSKI
jgi:hypothetical protein